MTPRIRFAILATGLLAVPGPAAAAVFCVGTSAELEAALATAEANGVDDEIRLRIGVYQTTSSAGFAFEPPSPTYDDELTVSGGWNAVCDRFGGASTNTVLDAFGLGPVFLLEVPAGAVAIRRLTVRGASTPVPALGALGLIPPIGAEGPDVVIDRVFFTDNVSTTALTVISKGIVQVLGCDFVGNTSSLAALWLDTCCSSPFASFVYNNTVAGNSVSSRGPVGGIYVISSPGTTANLRNNVFWDNEEADVELDPAGGTYEFHYNIYGEATGTVGGVGNLQVDPGFVDPAAGDHRLLPTSPARDSGDDGPSNLPLFDLLGVARPQDLWDRGAYELVPPIFADGFEAGDSAAWSQVVP